MKKLIIPLLAIISIGSLGANVFLWKKYSSSKPVLRFGEESVSLKDYRDALEFQYGMSTLRKLTLSKIVNSAAKKAGVYPAESAVDARIAELERVQPKLLEAAKQSATSMDQFKKDLATDIALESLRIKEVTVTPAEVEKYYNANKQRFFLPPQAKAMIVATQNETDAATAAEMLRNKDVTPAIIAQQPRLIVLGYNGAPNLVNALSPADRKRISDMVFKNPPGKVSRMSVSGKGPQNQTITYHFIIRNESQAKPELPPLDKIRDQVTRMVKASKARPETAVMADLYKQANITFEMDYKHYFRDLEQISQEPSAASPAPKK
jgi:hypothetical protein